MAVCAEKNAYYGNEEQQMTQIPFTMNYIANDGATSTKSANPLAVKIFNPSHSCNTAIQTDEKWEDPLLDECGMIMDLGLGRALDNTEQHPWEKKSHFQAKPVTLESLSVTQECNKYTDYSEHVENYSNFQAGFETTFQPVPNKPIDVSIAADAQRSCKTVKDINGKTVVTRTIGFKTQDLPCEGEEFESRLNQWLGSNGCIKCSICDGYQQGYCDNFVQKCEKCTRGNTFYIENTADVCLEFLKTLGGMTHYVSSLTMGAMKYTSSSRSIIQIFGESKASVGAYRFARGGYSVSASKFSEIFNTKTYRIGRIPQSSGREHEVVRMRTMDEAVINYSVTPLTHLIRHSYLELQLHSAIQVYSDEQLRGTRGPFHIATAEVQFAPDSNEQADQKKLYWMVTETVKRRGRSSPPKNSFVVSCTPNPTEASNFYLKLDQKGKKYFYIATDPNDKRHRLSPGIKRPQYFLHCQGIKLKGFSFIQRSLARFKLVDRENLTSLPVFESKWVPDKALGSQPHLISPKLRLKERIKSRTSKKALTVIFSEKKKSFMVRKLKRIKRNENVVNQLFVLEPGHKNYEE